MLAQGCQSGKSIFNDALSIFAKMSADVIP